MAYSVNFTDAVNKTPIVIDDNSRNTVDSSFLFMDSFYRAETCEFLCV